MKTVIGNQNLLILDNVISKNVCEYIIKYAERENDKKNTDWKFKPCKFGGSVNLEIRNSFEVHVKDKLICDLIWNFAKDIIPYNLQGRRVLGPDPRTFYLLRYISGEKFEIHRDGNSSYEGNNSFYTLMFYLSEVEEGGETIFFGEHSIGLDIISKYNNEGIYVCKPETGKMVLMRHYVLHKAASVKRGVKYVLRFNLLCEKFAPYYDGSVLQQNNIIVEYPTFHRDSNIYGFLYKKVDKMPINRQLSDNEEVCSNCNFILDLNYDYYQCPGCNMPVIITCR